MSAGPPSKKSRKESKESRKLEAERKKKEEQARAAQEEQSEGEQSDAVSVAGSAPGDAEGGASLATKESRSRKAGVPERYLDALSPEGRKAVKKFTKNMVQQEKLLRKAGGQSAEGAPDSTGETEVAQTRRNLAGEMQVPRRGTPQAAWRLLAGKTLIRYRSSSLQS